MKMYGVDVAEGTSISNLTVASGTSFPLAPNAGELFYRSDSDVRVRGLYLYLSAWERISSADSITTPSMVNFPALANRGDLFYKASGDSQEGLYVYNGSAWVSVVASLGGTVFVNGDVTGTLNVGSTSTLTLIAVGTAGTYGSASNTTVITTDSAGRVSAVVPTSIAISASQITTGTFADALVASSNVLQFQTSLALSASQINSGTFADARIASTSVTQYQSNLSIGASQLTGTIADARIAASSVTQYQGNLSITEPQIVDGALLARNAGSETITGSWQFNNPVITATPISGSHATTKDYVDAAVAGLSWKSSVRVATTANITLSGTQTIDGVAVVAGNRVLVKNQTTQSANGVYVVAAGAWTRSIDFDQTAPNDEVNSAAVFVQQGTTQADTAWTQTAPVSTVGTDAMVFTQFAGVNTFLAGAGLTMTGNSLDVNTASSARIVINTDNIDLALVGTAGTYRSLTIDGYGRATSGTNPTTIAGYGLTDAANISGANASGTWPISITGTASQLASAVPASGTASMVIRRASQSTGQTNFTFAGGTNSYDWAIFQAINSDDLGFYTSRTGSVMMTLGSATNNVGMVGSLSVGGSITGAAITGTTLALTSSGASDTQTIQASTGATGITIIGRASDNIGKIRFVNKAFTAELSALQDDGTGNLQLLSSGGVTAAAKPSTFQVANYLEPLGVDTRIMMRNGVGSPTKSGSINFSTGGNLDSAGVISFQRRQASGDAFEANLITIGLSTGNTSIAGALSVGGTLSSGTLSVSGAINCSGLITGTAASGDFSSSSVVSLLASNAGGSNGAVMGFIRQGSYGVKMGLDANNLFAIGGWSDGTSSRVYWDTGGNQVNRGGISAGGAISATAFSTTGNVNAVDVYASRGNNTGVIYFGGGAHYLYYDGTNYNMVSGGLYVGGAVYSSSLSLSGVATTSGVYSSGLVTGVVDGGSFDSSGVCSIMAQGNAASGGAVMAFHRAGAYAIKIGLDSGNLFAIGGWSSGTRVYWDTAGNQITTGVVRAGSDIRLKKDFEPIENVVEKIKQIEAFTYTDIASGERRIGVSAQSVQPVFPEAVGEDKDGMLSVAYGNIALAAFVEYVKVTDKRIADLEALVHQLLENRS